MRAAPPALHLARVSSPHLSIGCQCVPTPPVPSTPTAHTLSHPGFATTHTWLAFPRCLESI